MKKVLILWSCIAISCLGCWPQSEHEIYKKEILDALRELDPNPQTGLAMIYVDKDINTWLVVDYHGDCHEKRGEEHGVLMYLIGNNELWLAPSISDPLTLPTDSLELDEEMAWMLQWLLSREAQQWFEIIQVFDASRFGQ